MAGCLILLRIKEKVPQGDGKYYNLPQQWDVVTVVPDWWQPGSLDMADGETLFIECPDMEAEEAQARLLGREVGDEKDNPNLRMKALSVKGDLLPVEAQVAISKIQPIPVLKDDASPVPVPDAPIDAPIDASGLKEKSWDEIHQEARAAGYFITVKKNDVLSARVTKPPITNPFQIGDNPFQIT